MGRTLWEQGPDGVRRVEKPEQGDQEKQGQPSSNPAAPAPTPRPQRTTPGGSSLAALLIHNRTKTGQQKVLEPDGATPSQAQSGGSSGAFDLLEVTAVGGAPESAPAGPGGGGKDAGGDVPARRSYPTPGGGLPGLLARTQLGLGDAIRSFRESVGRTDAAAPPSESAPATGASAVVATPASAGDLRPAESPPPASEGETAAAAVAATTTEAGDGAVAVSGPVFELATGPVAGSGPVSGPVFDLVSGPFSGPATTVNAPVPAAAATPAAEATPPPTEAAAAGATPGPTSEQAAPRQAWSAPASGRLAALLAESRKRTGRQETLDVAAPPASGPAVPVPDPGPVSGASPIGSESASQDVATMRVPGAEVAQKKGPGFAATLLGLPAPELTPPVTRTGAIAVAGGLASRARPARDSAREAGAERNTPLPVEGEATERSLLSTGDMRARWSRNSEEQKRTTDIIDIVRPNRAGLRTGALILGGAAVLVLILVAVARVNRSGGEEKTTVTTTVPATTAPSVPSTAAAPGATTAAEERAAAAAIAPGEAPVGEAVRGDRGETKVAPDEAKAAAPAAEEIEAPPAPLPSAFRDTGSTPTRGDGASKRKVARSETRRSDTHRAEPKTRRRNVEARSARPEGTATAASYETPRPRVAQPLRPLQADPDGTLPLGMQ